MAVNYLVFAMVVVVAYAAIPIKFHLEAPQTIVYGNNPEQIFATDICDRDAGHAAMLALNVTDGGYRHFWEYWNQVTNTPLGFLISIANLDPVNDIVVMIHGIGHCEAWDCSGTAIANMYNGYNENPEKLLVPAGSDRILLDTGRTFMYSIIETGLMDMTIVGTGAPVKATLRHMTYRTLSRCDLRAPGLGYITRMDPNPYPENEGSVYKGSMPYSHAVANDVYIEIPLGTRSGTVLSVMYPRFNVTSRKWSQPIESRTFMTNLGPGMSYEAISSDMVPIDIPGWGRLYPDSCCDGRNEWPNVGNWAIEYVISGTIKNTDTVPRTLTISFPWPGCDSAVAYQMPGNWQWTGLFAHNKDVITYVKVTVNPGQSTDFLGRYMMGGPSCGGETHTITVY